MDLNDKLIENAKKAKTTEELLKLAKESGIELTDEEAKTYFAKLNSKEGELADDELGDVAGGRKCGTIYKDSRPVVFEFNTCDYFISKSTGEHYDGGFCRSCKYMKIDCVYVCDCPQRRDN